MKTTLIALSLALGGPGWADEAPAQSYGVYVGGRCGPREAKCVGTTARDQIRISRATDGKLNVAITIAFARGHSCGLESNDVEWSGTAFLVRADGLDEASPCQLSLELHGTELRVTDAEQRCRAVYCGARGTFEGTRFTRKR